MISRFNKVKKACKCGKYVDDGLMDGVSKEFGYNDALHPRIYYSGSYTPGSPGGPWSTEDALIIKVL